MAAITDATMGVIYQAMQGLQARQKVINTGNPTLATIDTARSTEAPGVDGNNVNLDDETVSMVQTGLKYQTMVEAMNAKFQLLRTAIGG